MLITINLVVIIIIFNLKINNCSAVSQNIKGTNADMKIYQYLCLHIKIICQRFRIITLFFIFEMYALEIDEMFVYKHAETIKYVKK